MNVLDPDATVGVETAARHLEREVPVISPSDTSATVLDSLRGRSYRHVAELAVCEGGRLRGVLRLQDALAADPRAVVAELMDSDPPTIDPGTDQEKAAWKAIQHGQSGIAVVDHGGRFVGFVPAQRLLAVLLQEHAEDLARLGGFLKGQALAREVSGRSLTRRLLGRGPWLIAGLVGSVAAAALVGMFGGLISGALVLAYFLPGIVYLADAVGTQTETVIVRDLAIEVPMRSIALSELVTGLAVGIFMGITAFPMVYFGWGRLDLALTFGVSLTAACTLATAVALILPWILNRLGFDPALGAGPLGTVLTDLCSIAIYFGVAWALMN